MNEPVVSLRLDGVSRVYQPGDLLCGEYRVQWAAPEDVRAVEVSVLWYTEGKGDEDLAVHYFRRTSLEEAAAADWRVLGSFETRLPNSPLSYQGVIVKVRWCVRVRAFLTRGREIVAQIPFRLGEVRRAKGAT